MEHRLPVVLGKDFAGTVDELGPGVTGYHVGDGVFGVVTRPYLGDGSFAEYVTVPVEVGLGKLPETIDHTGDLPVTVRREHPEGVDVVLHLAGDPQPHAQDSSRVNVRHTYPLEQVPAAFEAFASGTFGKLVITTA